MVQMRANINMDPQTPAEMELNDFPALFVQRPPSSWSPLSHIPIYDLYTIPQSPPPEEMAGPVRTVATDNRMTIQPPRPPNAWILYRSDKLRNLPPTAPGVPRRAQADVSKLISEMWKNELDDVRAEYERRADARKAEHQAMYPGYRFHPMKKEEKERLREEKRQEKERDRAQSRRGRARPTPYATSFVPTPMPHPLAAYYQPEVRYGPAGPSPPLSAASSPNDASPYPDSQHGSDEQPNQSTHASPHPDSYTSATSHSGSLPSMPTSSYESSIPPSQPLHLHPSPSQPGVSHLPIPGPSQWHPQQQPQVASGNADPATTSIWSNYNPSHGQFPLDGTVSQDYVSFNVPPLAVQPWMTSEGTSEFEQSIHALLSATGDPSIFQLSHFDPNSLTSHPSGEIEVSMGQLHFPFETQPSQLSSPDFSNFDFGSLSGPSSSHYLDHTNTGISPVDHTTDLASLFPSHAADPTSSTSENVDFSSYLNFDDVPPDVTPSRHTQSQSMPPIEQQAIETTTTPSAPYIPPAGAAYSSTRRVGASWKSSFTTAPDSPIDHSPPRQWGVPAS